MVRFKVRILLEGTATNLYLGNLSKSRLVIFRTGTNGTKTKKLVSKCIGQHTKCADKVP